MVTTRVVASPHASTAAAAQARGDLGVALYHSGSPSLPGLGRSLLESARKLPGAPSIRAWDFLTLALSVFGADRFVVRQDSADGWTRVIALETELVQPGPWQAESTRLAAALRFLTGDVWNVRFNGGGLAPPNTLTTTTDRDCVCLFSGGLDSLIGAMDLLAGGYRPLLVSQASPKEGPVQVHLAESIGLDRYRFEGRVSERHEPPYEPSMRARSVLFFAYGVLAASTIGRAATARGRVYVPENGFISVNPPLTLRRIGSLSTRTTHPYFVGLLQSVLDGAGLDMDLINPYRGKTKGEMLAECRDPTVRRYAAASYSCGKGKRLNMQCGRCVPCLIRRAAMRHAGIRDGTGYWAQDLAQYARDDDILAARLAVASLNHRDVERWASESGPLPTDRAERQMCVGVVRRGLEELRAFLDTIRWL